MRKLLPLLLVTAVAAPLAGRADGSIVITGRGGAARAFGDAASRAPMGDLVNWAFPLQADLQFRFHRQFQAGGYFRYSPIMLPWDVRDVCSSCSANGIAFGAVAEYRFSDRIDGGGWLGLSVGYEALKSESTAAGAKVTATASGFEGSLQGGFDFQLGGLNIGPFVHAGLGQYGDFKTEVGGSTTSGSISGKAPHAWAGVGLRFNIVL